MKKLSIAPTEGPRGFVIIARSPKEWAAATSDLLVDHACEAAALYRMLEPLTARVFVVIRGGRS